MIILCWVGLKIALSSIPEYILEWSKAWTTHLHLKDESRPDLTLIRLGLIGYAISRGGGGGGGGADSAPRPP